MTVVGTSTQGAITASGLITANLGLTIPAGNALTANGGLTVVGTSTQGAITASGLITANLGLTIPAGNALTANGGLTVVGTSTQAAITASGLITANLGLTIPAGNTLTANGGLTVGGAITATSQTVACGAITTNGTLTATSQLIQCGTLTTSGGITASGLITASAGLTVPTGQSVAINGTSTLSVAGTSTLSNTTITGSLVVTGGTLNVTGKISNPGLDSSYNTLIGLIGAGGGGGSTVIGTLNVTSSTTLAGGLNVTGGSLNVSGGTTLGGLLNVTGITLINNSTASTTTDTGAFEVLGGVGIGGNINAGSSSAAHNIIAGAGGITLTSTGGVGDNVLTSDAANGVANQLIASGANGSNLITATGVGGSNQFTAPNNNVTGNLILLSTIDSTSTSTGILQVAGGASIAGNLYAGRRVVVNSTLSGSTNGINLIVRRHTTTDGTVVGIGFGISSTSPGDDPDLIKSAIIHERTGSSGVGNLYIAITNSTGGTVNVSKTDAKLTVLPTGQVIINTTQASTSSNTGALQVRGGLGVSGNVYALAYYATSDNRVKTNISNLDIPSLDVLRNIQPRKYDHIDTEGYSNEPVYGFVAQEIKQLLPNAVSFRSDYIPSIYEMAFIDDRVITLINKSTNDISMCNIKFLSNRRDEIICKGTGIFSEKKFIIDKNIPDSDKYTTDISGNVLVTTIRNGKSIYMRGSEEYTGVVRKCIFVYGHYINDFHVVNKDTIWTVLLSSTQELDKQLQLANSKIVTQDIRIAELEDTIQKQQADIDAIKQRLG